MPGGLSSKTALPIKPESVAISTSYPNLSTFRFPPKAAWTAGYLPNERRLISVSARFGRRGFFIHGYRRLRLVLGCRVSPSCGLIRRSHQ